ncbi:MAG TPA: flagellar filament capping protein FliD [Candidatus Binatia bacterium]|nr:flagellar filament capping protein FliD [Candidatus Binatia bacterium]
MSSTLNVGAALALDSQTGLGTGIDVSSYVQAALAAQSAPLTLAQQQQSQLTTQTTALNTLSSELQSLLAAAQALNDPAGQFNALSVTSSNTSAVVASATAGAATGNHTVTVNSLATTSSEYSQTFATSSTPTNTGTFNISVGGAAAVPITVNSTNNTLAGIASAINAAGAGVTASVINDASGSRLAIVSNTSGAPGDISISGDTVGLGFTKSANGLNASLVVDGIPISSASNTVTGVISGVTLNLLSANPNVPVSLSVAPDATQAQSAINSFVTAYNAVVNDLNSQVAVDPSTGQQGPLGSDSSINLVQDQVLSAVAYAVSGNSGIVNLASIGVNFNDDGTLTVDNGTLSSALASNFQAVQNFLQGGASSFGANLTASLQSLTDPTQGPVALDLNGISLTQQDLTQQINDFQAQLAVAQQTLNAKFSQVDTILQELPLLQAQVASQLSSL